MEDPLQPLSAEDLKHRRNRVEDVLTKKIAHCVKNLKIKKVRNFTFLWVPTYVELVGNKIGGS